MDPVGTAAFRQAEWTTPITSVARCGGKRGQLGWKGLPTGLRAWGRV